MEARLACYDQALLCNAAMVNFLCGSGRGCAPTGIGGKNFSRETFGQKEARPACFDKALRGASM